MTTGQGAEEIDNSETSEEKEALISTRKRKRRTPTGKEIDALKLQEWYEKNGSAESKWHALRKAHEDSPIEISDPYAQYGLTEERQNLLTNIIEGNIAAGVFDRDNPAQYATGFPLDPLSGNAIKDVENPFKSFGNEPNETPEQFYLRIRVAQHKIDENANEKILADKLADERDILEEIWKAAKLQSVRVAKLAKNQTKKAALRAAESAKNQTKKAAKLAQKQTLRAIKPVRALIQQHKLRAKDLVILNANALENELKNRATNLKRILNGSFNEAIGTIKYFATDERTIKGVSNVIAALVIHYLMQHAINDIKQYNFKIAMIRLKAIIAVRFRHIIVEAIDIVKQKDADMADGLGRQAEISEKRGASVVQHKKNVDWFYSVLNNIRVRIQDWDEYFKKLIDNIFKDPENREQLLFPPRSSTLGSDPMPISSMDQFDQQKQGNTSASARSVSASARSTTSTNPRRSKRQKTAIGGRRRTRKRRRRRRSSTRRRAQ